jgi:hypothetical protein
VQKLISPHVDKARGKKVRAKQWLRSELGGKTGAKAPSPSRKPAPQPHASMVSICDSNN